MFARVTVHASDLAASRKFYEIVVGALERDPWEVFKVTDRDPPTRHLHIAFAAMAPEDVEVFWRAGVDAGYRGDGEPGPRPQYTPDYFGGFLLDPDGNSVEAVYRPGRTETGSPIDHLWLGVANLEASRREWEALAAQFGLQVEDARIPGLVVVAGDKRHIMLVPHRAPTENAGIELAAPEAQ